MSSLAMRRDQREIWPDDTPPGTFDIEGTVWPHIFFVCPRGQRCGVFLTPTPPEKVAPCKVWMWNGDRERPTLTPSLNCRDRHDDGRPTGGCGWHGHITAGAMEPAA